MSHKIISCFQDQQVTLQKATSIVATLFIICSLGLTIISRGELTPTTSVIDKIEENADDAPKVPENSN